MAMLYRVGDSGAGLKTSPAQQREQHQLPAGSHGLLVAAHRRLRRLALARLRVAEHAAAAR